MLPPSAQIAIIETTICGQPAFFCHSPGDHFLRLRVKAAQTKTTLDNLGIIQLASGKWNMMNFWCSFQHQDSNNIKGEEWLLRKSNCHHPARGDRGKSFQCWTTRDSFNSQASVTEIKESATLSGTRLFPMLSALLHFTSFLLTTSHWKRWGRSVNQIPIWNHSLLEELIAKEAWT